MKYRVWDKKLNMFVTDILVNIFGHLIILEGNRCCLLNGKDIENFIVCKCSEYRDRNGKEIYEGDILKIHSPILNDKYIEGKIAKVIFKKGSFWINIEYEISESDTYILYEENLKYEIIGNIYENPEMELENEDVE